METGGPAIEAGLLELIRIRVDATDAAVRLVFARSASFRSLSRDFRLCVRALEHWKSSDSEKGRQRVEEYSVLLDALVQEMRQMVRDESEGVRTQPEPLR